jgi:hypothetical protein
MMNGACCRLPRDQYYDHDAEEHEMKKDEDKRKKLTNQQSESP